jgi:NADPH:quinone reductase-like Zn-dependent oxidoreductase
MRAYELHPEEGFGAVTRVDRPAVATLAPHEVRVRVRAVSLNFRDLNIARMAKKRASAKRVVPTSDGAGEVIEIGTAVTRVAVGDRVAASFFPAWIDGGFRDEYHAQALGGSVDGMLAEEVVLGERAWVRIPSFYTFEQAATLPCAGVTAWHALFEAAALRPGDSIVVQGTGGVSIFALQLARVTGARVHATSSSAEKRARLVQMGGETAIDYRENPKWGEAVRVATGGRGVDIAVEVGGPGTFDQSIKALRPGGTMSILGVLTGTQGPVDTYAIFHRNARVHGVYVGSVTMFESLVRAIEATRLEPIIDRVFGFDEARAAYEYLASGSHFGKVVVRVD